DDQHGGGHEVHATGALPLVGATSTRRSGPRSSGDRAPPSGGGSAGSNPAGGATGDDTPSALLQGRYRARHRRPPGRRRGAGAPHRREPDQVPGPALVASGWRPASSDRADRLEDVHPRGPASG